MDEKKKLTFTTYLKGYASWRGTAEEWDIQEGRGYYWLKIIKGTSGDAGNREIEVTNKIFRLPIESTVITEEVIIANEN